MRYVLHKFRPTETIDAVLRLKGRHNYTRVEILELRKRFNELNGQVVPYPGDVFKIPLEDITVDDYGDVVPALQVAQEVQTPQQVIVPEVEQIKVAWEDEPEFVVEEKVEPEIPPPQPKLSVGGSRRR